MRNSSPVEVVVNSNSHSRHHRHVLTWDELFLLDENMAMNIWKLAQKYGYKYDWNYTIFNQTTRFNHPFANNPKKQIHC